MVRPACRGHSACQRRDCRVHGRSPRAAAPAPRGSDEKAWPTRSALLLRPRPGLEARLPRSVRAEAAGHPLYHQPLGLQALSELFIFLQSQEEFFF